MTGAARIEQIRAVASAILRSEGSLAPALRQAAYERALELAGRRTASGHEALCEPLGRFVEVVVLHAYKVTDQDIEALKAASHDEDAIFEATVSAAVGAGIGRLEAGLSLLATGSEP